MATTAILGIIGGLLIGGSFILYAISCLQKKTEPHVYTWLIWTITHGLAAVAVVSGGGGIYASIPLVFATLLSLFIFALGLRYGSTNITLLDTATLMAAGVAIMFWWKLNHPDWTVLTIAIADLLGFFPTYRKCLKEPHSEPINTWVLYVLGNLLALAALSTYTIQTSFYISVMVVASTALVLLIVIKRRF